MSLYSNIPRPVEFHAVFVKFQGCYENRKKFHFHAVHRLL